MANIALIRDYLKETEISHHWRGGAFAKIEKCFMKVKLITAMASELLRELGTDLRARESIDRESS